MQTKDGKSVFDGIAMGKIKYYRKPNNAVLNCSCCQAASAEMDRFENARLRALEDIKVLCEKAKKDSGEKNAEIFEAYQMLLEDQGFCSSVNRALETSCSSVESAVISVCDKYVKIFLSSDDEQFRARAEDVKNIADRILTFLCDWESKVDLGEEPVIIAAEELSPCELIQMDRNKILALLVKNGSACSHMAILAKSMGIPTMVGVAVEENWDGKYAVVDSFEDCVILDPDEEMIGGYRKNTVISHKNDKMESVQEPLLEACETKGLIRVCANIGSVEEAELALQQGADGIGLFRSEFLYMEADHFPTEEEQFQVYKAVLEKMNGKKVTIRTLDLGSDKNLSYFGLEKEENPALGNRSIRLCYNRQEIFETQLRALYRAGVYGHLAIVYPMINSMEELRWVKKISSKVCEDLTAEGYQISHVEEGIMVETPAAALISDILAEEADFFSIGTNDLTQFTLAVDRQNTAVDVFYNEHHPAVIRLLEMIVRNAHDAGICVGICGELGADSTMIEKFLEMKMDEISVSPYLIGEMKEKIREGFGL